MRYNFEQKTCVYSKKKMSFRIHITHRKFVLTLKFISFDGFFFLKPVTEGNTLLYFPYISGNKM